MVPSLFPDWFGGEEGGGCLGRSAQSDRYTERRQLDLCCLDDVDARQNACWGNLGDLPVFVHSRSSFPDQPCVVRLL